MAAESMLNGEMRDRLGKGASRATRRGGRIPAVIYGGDKDPVHLSLHPVELDKQIHQGGFLSRIFTVEMGKDKETVIPRDVQFHPVKDVPIHVDFVRVKKGDTIHASVPLHFINEEKSPGIKKGGVLNITIHNLEINCPVEKIPASIDIDLTGLEIHGTIHLSDLKLPAGVVATHPERDNDIANIVAPTVMKQTEEETAETAGSEEKTEK